jgi:predicted Zn-dependent peptidase
MAAMLSVTAGMSSLDATINGSALTENFPALMEIAADVLLNPSFAEQELALFKQRTSAQLVQQRTQPSFLAMERFNRIIYNDHPAGRTAPTQESLKGATREQLAAFHKARYVPDYAALAVAGDITLAEVRKLVDTHLGAWKKAGAPELPIADPAEVGAAKVALVSRPNSVQTSLVVGAQAIKRTSPDYDVVQVMNKIVGGGPTGRLFMHLREEKGYTYGAYSNLSPARYRGDWSASTDVRSEVTGPALADLLAEVAAMREQAVPDKDLQTSKRAMIASFALSLESPQQMLNYYTQRWLYKLPSDYWDKYPERVSAVTAAQVQEAARKYLDPSRLQIVAVGDAAKIQELLTKHGKVEVYDAEGKRVSQ